MSESKQTEIMQDPVIEKMQRYITITNMKHKPGSAYSMNFSEVFTLSKLADETKIDAISLAFEYGRAKGALGTKKVPLRAERGVGR